MRLSASDDKYKIAAKLTGRRNALMRFERDPDVLCYWLGLLGLEGEIDVGGFGTNAMPVVLPNLFIENEALIADPIYPCADDRVALEVELVDVIHVDVHHYRTPGREQEIRCEDFKNPTSSGL